MGIAVINPVDFGAVGDGVFINDDAIATAYALAKSFNKPLEFPAGNFKVSKTTTISSNYRVIRGQNGLTKLSTTENIPIFTIDLHSEAMYYSTIADIDFEGSNDPTLSGQCGLLVVGDGTFYCSDNQFRNLRYLNIYAGFHIAIIGKSVGLDTPFVWNTISGTQTVNVQNAIWFSYGSGTGNVIHGGNIVASLNCILYEGLNGANIGDILISAVHFGGAGRGVVLKETGSYRSRVSILGCQFDAGITTSISARLYSYLDLLGNNYGGASPPDLKDCTFVRMDLQTPGILQASTQNNAGAGTGVLPFKVTLGDAGSIDWGYGGAMVEITSEGQIGGRGACIATSRFHLFRSGPTASGYCQIDTSSHGVGAGILTHAISQSGMDFTMAAISNASAAGTYLFSTIRVVGHNVALVVL